MTEEPQHNSWLKRLIEGAILAYGQSITIDKLREMFDEHERPERDDIRAVLAEIGDDCANRGFELKETASGFRFQVRRELSPWIAKLWEEKPKKYSRAVLETLALIAYRQPITRGDIEQIRGVSVSSEIIRSLQEREWVRVVGHRDVPGRPALYATTRQFLDYFNLKSLEELPPLDEIRDLADFNGELNLEEEQSRQANQTREAADTEETDTAEQPPQERATAQVVPFRSVDGAQTDRSRDD